MVGNRKEALEYVERERDRERRSTLTESLVAFCGERCASDVCDVDCEGEGAGADAGEGAGEGEGEGDGDRVRSGLNCGPSNRVRYSFTLADDDLRFSSRPILRHSSATWSERRRNSAIFSVSWWDEVGERGRGSAPGAGVGAVAANALRRPATNSVDE